MNKPNSCEDKLILTHLNEINSVEVKTHIYSFCEIIGNKIIVILEDGVSIYNHKFEKIGFVNIPDYITIDRKIFTKFSKDECLLTDFDNNILIYLDLKNIKISIHQIDKKIKLAWLSEIYFWVDDNYIIFSNYTNTKLYKLDFLHFGILNIPSQYLKLINIEFYKFWLKSRKYVESVNTGGLRIINRDIPYAYPEELQFFFKNNIKQEVGFYCFANDNIIIFNQFDFENFIFRYSKKKFIIGNENQFLIIENNQIIAKLQATNYLQIFSCSFFDEYVIILYKDFQNKYSYLKLYKIS